MPQHNSNYKTHVTTELELPKNHLLLVLKQDIGMHTQWHMQINQCQPCSQAVKG